MDFGSKIYGTQIPTSDIDVKFIFQPDGRSILLESAQSHRQSDQNNDVKNTPEDIDLEGFSLKKYLHHLAQGQTFAFDMLFTPQQFWIGKPDPVWLHIQKNRHRLISKKIDSFVGYCRAQFTKYSFKANRLDAVLDILTSLEGMHNFEKIKTYISCFEQLALKHPDIILISNGMLGCCGRQVPLTATIKTAKEIYTKLLKMYGERTKQSLDKNAIDWKALYHAVRVAKEAEELLLTGNITLPRPEAPLLLEIRKGILSFDEVRALIEQSTLEVEDALLKTTLPDEPDYEFINDIVCDQNQKAVEKYLCPHENLLAAAQLRGW
jgi:hypothetical protein